MKHLKWTVNCLLILCLIFAVATGCSLKNKNSSINTNNSASYSSNQLLVKVKPGTDIVTVLKNINGQVLQYNNQLGYYKISFNVTQKMSLDVARRILYDTNQVTLAEPNYVYHTFMVPNDPEYAKQWGLQKIYAPSGWDQTTGSSSVVIAIVDTGIDHTHPDLLGKVISGYNAITNVTGLPGDDNGHGTHCAGIASASSNNGQGVAGVAWNCTLLPVKVLYSNGSGYTSDIAEGIIWAADHGADVISMSLGGGGYSRILQNAIDYAINKNVTVVAAAGNDSRLAFNSPAGLPGVISVGATNPNNVKASFSTESNSLFISAPGEQIYSTFPQNSYQYLSGTSMATPFVSGAVALIKSKFGKNIPVTQIQSQLKQTATDIGSTGWDQQTGWGLLNLNAALTSLQPNQFGSLIVTANIPNVQVLLSNNGRSIANIVTDANGKASFWSLLAGSYQVTVFNGGNSKSTTVVVSAGSTNNITLSYLPDSISYTSLNETAENTPAQAAGDGTWAKTTTTSHSGTSCWTDSPDGNYNNNANMSLNLVPINMTGSTSPILYFWHKYAMETNFDNCGVEVSADGGMTWTLLNSWTGTMSNWTQVSVNLSAYKTSTCLLIRFRFTSDGSVVNDGWYIDDISISG